jgi:hypothetical protein
MFPQLSEALLHERVRDLHRAAEASRLARSVRKGRSVAAATTSQPVAARHLPVLRGLTTASRSSGRHAGAQHSRRAA